MTKPRYHLKQLCLLYFTMTKKINVYFADILLKNAKLMLVGLAYLYGDLRSGVKNSQGHRGSGL